jgi:hypothetical protein
MIIQRELRIKQGHVFHHLQCIARTHPGGFMRGRIAGLERLSPDEQTQVTEIVR